MFKNSYGFINKAIRNNKFKKTVVVTHHAPSILCIAQEHKNSSLNDAFVVDLSKFIYNNNIDYWIYGHTHRNVAEVEINGTKIVTNQLGYVQMDEQSGFKNSAVIELK
ncbi:MAG: metallophosphoesterase [Draconibacterium sp.]|nr:metallophosphoesterase [Draconibacterium sp.]